MVKREAADSASASATDTDQGHQSPPQKIQKANGAPHPTRRPSHGRADATNSAMPTIPVFRFPEPDDEEHLEEFGSPEVQLTFTKPALCPPRSPGPHPPIVQGPRPNLKSVEFLPRHYCVAALESEPPITVAQALSTSHNGCLQALCHEMKLRRSPSDILELLAIAAWERGLSGEGLRQRVYQKAIELKGQVDAIIHGYEEEEVTQWYEDLKKGTASGELLLWLLEEVAGHPILILRFDRFDGRWSRPLQDHLGRSAKIAMAHESGPFIGLYHAGGHDFHLIVPSPSTSVAGAYTHFPNESE